MFIAFIIILFVIFLSKCNSCSKDKRELQEEPITLYICFKTESKLKDVKYLFVYRKKKVWAQRITRNQAWR